MENCMIWHKPKKNCYERHQIIFWQFYSLNLLKSYANTWNFNSSKLFEGASQFSKIFCFLKCIAYMCNYWKLSNMIKLWIIFGVIEFYWISNCTRIDIILCFRHKFEHTYIILKPRTVFYLESDFDRTLL
jgi:hypothetical protein